jgi:acyl transferase domain-containing protein/NAD(P)-dependent dehydrogenase (short-subunit alcohol dehydrogenase family)/acyl carrier protein
VKPSLEQIEAALRTAVKEAEQLRRQNRRLLEAADEPIAIVGMSCRYPGDVASPAGLWELVARGGDAISAFPEDRGWDPESGRDPEPGSPGSTRVREGGFLADAADFDHEFFGIGASEAKGLDPQLRLFLEGCWEALEGAGIDPGELRGNSTGVFAGVMYHDYGWGLSATAGTAPIATGGTSSIVSGHVAYTLGLEGPTLSVDTACSSSLVAIHLACQTLRNGDSPLALAGGVTVLSTPAIFSQLAGLGGVARDGRCKAFGAGADGTGFSEGVGVLVLERLSEAERNGHTVLATIRGSAINQDGASNGVTAPNGPAQERLIRQALASAGLAAADVEMVEAHGTGTALGDPIEANALLATYGQDREEPLRLGSLKSNIGHTQAAAGVGGVIKSVMALREAKMPRTLHADEPTPAVDWSSGEVELLTETRDWEGNGRPRRAAVSSFGASGTNAHLILEEAPERAEASAGAPAGDGAEVRGRPLAGPIPLVLSAKSEPALREQARRLAARLAGEEAPEPIDVAASLTSTRARFERRAVALGEDREQLLAGLRALGRGDEHPALVGGRAEREAKVAFLFPGSGSQWPGMALKLIEESPVFAAAMAECEEAFSPYLERPMHDTLRGSDEAWLRQLPVAQPLVFSTMVSLARLWRACGVEPAAVAGHSQGEVAAAHVAGGLSLEDAALILAVRTELLVNLAPGGLVSVRLPADELEERLASWGEKLEIAALNSPASLVVSGERGALDELLAVCEEDGVRARDIVGGGVPSHSVYVEPMREALLERLASISPCSGEVPFYSTVAGEAIDTAGLDAEYWYLNLRRRVLFEPIVGELLGREHRLIIEVNSHPVLVPAVQETIEAGFPATDAVAIGTLRRDEGGAARFVRSLAEAHAHGARVDWPAFFGPGTKKVSLPTYPFQRERFWLDPVAGGAASLASAGLAAADHPLLGAAIEDPSGEGFAMSGRVSPDSHPWLLDHTAFGVALLPGAAFLELALRAGLEAGAPVVEELALEAPLVLAEGEEALLRVSVGGADERGGREISIHSRPADAGEGEAWTRHAHGVVVAATAAPPRGVGDAADWPPPGAEPIDVDGAYRELAAAGIDYGPAFRGLRAAWRCGEEIYAEVGFPGERDEAAERFLVHPALLDATGHAAVASMLAGDGALAPGELPMPFAWKGARLGAGAATSLRVRTSAAADAGALTAVDPAGNVVVSIDEFVHRPVDRARLRAALPGSRSLYRVEWRPLRGVGEDEPAVETTVEDVRDPGGGDRAEAARALCAGALERIQAFLAAGGEGEGEARLAFLVERALAVSPTDERALAVSPTDEPDPAQAALAGLVRSAASEHPGRFLLIDTDGSEASEAALAPALAADPREGEIALREGKPLVPRLAALKGVTEEAAGLDPERTVLITGAMGGIGARVARHLAEAHGARHLLLVSRSGESAAGAAQLRAALEELGASVEIAACDVSDREALAALLAAVDSAHPLGAVIHCAAVLDDATVESANAGQLARVFAPKADAAWHLHELTAGAELAWFVCFSSFAGVIGGAGQASYAAANSFLDALAARRRAAALPAVSIAWGGWELESEMAAGIDRDRLERGARQIAERYGLVPFSVERGLELFDAALTAPVASIVPAQLDLGRLRSRAGAGTLGALFSGLVRAPARGAAGGGSLARRLADAAEAGRAKIALDAVSEHVAAVLGLESAAEVATEKPFKDLGFDSLAAVELRNRLVADSGIGLATTVVFDYPSPAALAEHLLELVTGDSAAARVFSAARGHDEPIAIVGMSCRFPGGVSSPRELWELLTRGGDAISPLPGDRGWDLERLLDPRPGEPGKVYVSEGGFLPDAADFDPAFFEISPRDAIEMDPQQRLMLEASWEALEDAGIDPRGLRGSDTGVFAGSMYQDYGAVSSMTSSGVCGYVSYALGLEGPSLSVDTACSSSLVATHLAAAALRAGECDLALAGGVAVLSTPAVLVEFSRQRNLAPNGRCKSFAEAADGTAISDGVGLLALERLSDAERNGHAVLATIRGSAVNQDGASNGLAAPNGPAQERVIRQALANAGLAAADVEMVEAHGTGTVLGDPIEANALIATYGQEREGPVHLGTLKSNIGHTQAAAGVGGVIKAVMAMRERTMPATLHVDAPSSKVDWSAGKVELLLEPRPWEANGAPRRAAVSSFGASGTNAHLILEEGAPEPAREAAESPPAALLPFAVSAQTEAALRDQAGRLVAHLDEHPDLELADVAFSLATSRAQLERRAVAVAGDGAALREGLAAIAAGRPDAGVVTGRARAGRLAFLFSGQGSQRAGMGSELWRTDPVFAEALEEVLAELAPHMEHSLADLLRAKAGTPRAALLDRTAVAQPALFAVEVALARALGAIGLAPDLLAGHSVGGIAAAHLGGVFSLADACAVVAARGRLMDALPEGGAMVALEADEEEAREAIGGREEALAVAAVNGSRAVVVSGEAEALAAVEAQFSEQGRKTKRLAVSHAFHSPLIEPMLDDFERILAAVELRPPTLAVVSDSSGELLSAEQAIDPAYWVSHARRPVRFAAAIDTLLGLGARAFVELGPGAALAAMASERLDSGVGAVAVPALRGERSEPESLLAALAASHAAGLGPDWKAFFSGSGARRVALPTYPFQRSRYWLDPGAAGNVGAVGLDALEHPLLGAGLEVAAEGGEGLLLTGRISASTHPWLADHALAGRAIVPGTALLELALRAGAEAGLPLLEELTLALPLILPEEGFVQIQVGVAPADDEGRRALSVRSRGDGSGAEWTVNGAGILAEDRGGSAPPPLGVWPPAGAERIDVEGIYDQLEARGAEFGPAFQGLVEAWREGETLLAEAELAAAESAEADRFGLHPALLDALSHAAVGAAEEGEGGLVLPIAWQGVRLHARGASRLRARMSVGAAGNSLVAYDGDGAPAISIESVSVRPLNAAVLPGGARSLYGLSWKSVAAPGGGEPGLEAELCDLREGGAGTPADPLELLDGALRRAQEWLGVEEPAGGRLTFLTRNAVAAADGEAPDPAAAAVWGLIRTAQNEHPGRFALVDLDASQPSRERLGAALAIGGEEPQLALRGGELLVPRLARAAAMPEPTPDEPIGAEASVLVVGGLSGLGAAIARHAVAARGARHLILVGRRGAETPGAAELEAALREDGAETIRIEACDVADREALGALLDSIPAERPLRVVVHSAAVLDDGVLASLDRDRLARVLAPKVGGAWNLHELTREMELSQFVLCSSLAGQLGGAGQASYAAANSFLDALAQWRHAEGLPATSIAWGALDVDSALAGAERAGEIAAQVRRRFGMTPIPRERTLALFDQAAARPEPLLAAVEFDAAALRERAGQGALAVVQRDLVRVTRRPSEVASLSQRLAGVPFEEWERVALELVREHAAAVLGHESAEAIEADRPFQELGFDSLAAVELRNRLSASSGTSLPPTLVFDYPSARAVAAHLVAALESAEAGPALDEEEVALREALAQVPLARLREAGLMEDLLEVVGLGQSAGANGEADIESIDSLGFEDLVARGLAAGEGKADERDEDE